MREKFVGAWRLAGGYEIQADGSKKKLDQYDKTLGYIMYTADGHMSVLLMDNHRPEWKDAEVPSDAERLSAIKGFRGYSGTYSVDPKECTITHHVEIDFCPNHVGIERKRHYVLTGDLVEMHVLSPVPPGHRKGRYLVWQRMAR